MEYTTLTIHTPNEELMKEFITKFNDINKKINYKQYSYDNIKFKYHDEKDNLLKNCEWYEMPEFIVNKELYECPSMTMKYNKNDKKFLDEFNKLNLKIMNKSTWYPSRLESLYINRDYYYTTEKIIPKYPIYIISKGRWETRYTSKYLEQCDIDYKIVVEPQEYDNYKKYINQDKILILPDEYLNKNQGGIPARNFVLNHSRNNNDKRHWILDDNIMSYYRLNNSDRVILKSGCIFKIIEDYVDRYTNIKMAGHNYKMFGISTNTSLRPITKNTRIYSSILLSNDIPFEWRGKYNEDTDMSLRLLKLKYPTILFNCILADKQTTLAQKGGNTDTIYNVKNGLYLKAKSLLDQHPDVVKIIKKYGRDHHLVNYSLFKNNIPILDDNIKLKDEINNYGMKLIKKV
jgi:hypothetical protein